MRLTRSLCNKLKKIFSYLLLIPILVIGTMFLASPITQASTPLVCNMFIVTGDDDGSFPMTLPFSLTLGSTEYNQIFYSTNATVTFGQADGTYWDYPQTPSVSVAGYDWVTWGEGAYTSYGYNDDSFCIEWSVRPYPQSTGPLTQIRLVVNKFPNGGWHGEIITMTDLPPDARRGIRYERDQPVVLMEAAFDVNGGTPVEVEPAPTPTPEPTVEPSPTANPEPEQSQSPEPVVEPSLQPLEPSPEPSETFEPPLETSPTPTFSDGFPSEFLLPSQEPVEVPSPDLEPEISFPESLILIPDESPFLDLDLPSTDLPFNNDITDGLTAEEAIALEELLTEYGPLDAISFESFEESGLDYEDLPPDQPIMLENGVILTAEVVDAIEMFENPSELLITVLTDPGKVLKAFANIGADMTPEQRKESQIVVVASIIVGQIITATSIATGRVR